MRRTKKLNQNDLILLLAMIHIIFVGKYLQMTIMQI